MHKKHANFSLRCVKIILDFFAKVLYNIKCNFAGVVELADAPDSKSGGSDTMRVRPPPPAPNKKALLGSAFLFLRLNKEFEMIKEIEINGCVEVPPEITMDEFCDAFIEFIESKGWYFGGGFREIVDGYYVNPDGTKGKFVVDKE